MHKITSSVRTGGLIIFLLVFALTNLTGSTGKLFEEITITSNGISNVSCNNGNDGAINVTVTGGNGTYTYDWTGPNSYSSTNEDLSGIVAGTYYLNVTDADGNSASKDYTIDEPAQLFINNTDYSKPSCKGNQDGSIISIDVTGGTSGYEYRLDNGTYQNSKTFTGLKAGGYTLFVRDANGCEVSKSIEILEPEALNIQGSTSTPASCNGVSDGQITAGTVSGGTAPYEYKINGRSYQTDETFYNFSNGTYTVTVKDANGCTATESITVNEPDALNLSGSTTTPVSCNGAADGTATAGTALGGNDGYEYSINGSNFSTSKTFNDLSAGNYTITVRDSKGCETSETVTISEPEVLSLSGSTTTPVSCNGGADGTATAGSVTGGNDGYEYSINGSTYSSSKTFNNLSAGNYTIHVRDSKGCETSETVTISEPEVLSLSGSTTTPVSCNGGADGTATAGTATGGNGGYEYNINGSTFSTSKTFSDLSAGNYTITVRDSKGCETSETVTISEPQVLSLSGSTTTPVSCNGGADGTATAGTATGGNGGYEYSINGGTFSTETSFNNLSAGNHTITVRDNKGCETTETILITEPAPLSSTPPTSTPVSCNGGSDGTITAGTPSGGNGEYFYSLDGNSFNPTKTFTNLSAGTYQVYIRDSKNCLLTQNIEVAEPEALSMTTPSSTEATCFGGSDGTITVGTMSGGNGNYQYSLDNNNFTTSTTFTGLTAGNYTIFVKDEKGCAFQKTITVSQPNELNATLNTTNVSCFEGADGKISLSQVTGGHGNYEYSVDGISWQSEKTIENLSSGTYSVYIRDADYPDCEIILDDSVEITQPAAPLNATVSTTRTTSYESATGSATTNASGGTAGYTYEYRFAGSTNILQTTKTANNLTAGDYEVTVTDTKGCSYVTEFTIVETIDATIIPTSICSDNEEEIIRTSYFEVEDLTARGGVGPYTYQWSFGSDSTPSSANGPGSHQVKYSTTGNKNITLIVTDSQNISKEFTYTQFVGECYRDNCGSNDFIGSSYYIGDAEGNPATVANCNDGVQKYIHMTLSSGTDRYSLYAEITYTITDVSTGESNTVTENGCFYENELIPDKVRTIEVPWECGSVITIDRIYLTFSNNIKWSCGQGPNPKCFSTNNEETVESPLYATATPNELECYGEEFGTIDVRASGGRSPYTYSITSATSGFQTESTFNDLPAGDYDVWVKDYDGLIYQIPTVTITQPDNPISLETSIVNPTCYGGMGEATVSATGGTPFETGEPYEYLWNDPSEQTTSNATGLAAGDYTITVIDANGCQAIETVTITQPDELTVAATGEDQNFSCGFNTTNLKANTPVTGTGSWSIISGSGGSILEPSNPNSEFTGTSGSYTLRWTISHPDGSCSTTSDMTVTFESDCSTLDFDGVDDHVMMGDNYPLSSGSFSIEVWVKPKSVSGVRTVLSKRDYSNMSNGGFDLIINNGAPTFRWGNNSVSTSSKVSTDRWYHLAVIYSNSKVELYVDGINVGNSSASNPGSTSASFILGAMYDSSNPDVPKNYFEGWIEELRIWNTSLTVNQLRFMMNQRVTSNNGNTKGEVLPMNVPNALSWSNLQGYYRLMANEITNGETPDLATNKVNGYLRNIETSQENTAPLPYISNQDGSWRSSSTWLRPTVWDVPNGLGINGDYINWNIAVTEHDIYSTQKNIYLLGLISNSGEITMDGSVPNVTGQGLTVSHYLRLDGVIDLEGDSQLVQTEGSILDESSSGYIEKDQQGIANSFNYNYWTSPVSLTGNANNSGFRIKDVLLDGTNPANPKALSFNRQYHWADYYDSSQGKRISSYWLYTFKGEADNYFVWHQISETDLLDPGIGYSMKGTMGYVSLDQEQNYVFKGKPHNGDITVNVGTDQNLLTGNPYPSAIDSYEFIDDNLSDFNGSLYFWDHFGKEDTHYLEEYIGGYAVMNKSGSVAPASSIDSRINDTGQTNDDVLPGRYIPVGQAFFISTIGVSNPATVTYRNKYRAFVPENGTDSNFRQQENTTKQKNSEKTYKKDTRFKIRLKFESPKGYHRQILVTADSKTTSGFDLGYDAPLIENNVEDMYWMINDSEFVIQAVPHFNLNQVLPLGIKVAQEGEFTIKIDKLENFISDYDIYLHDKSDDSYYNLTEEDFESTIEETGTFNDRFELVFQNVENEPEEKPILIEDDSVIGVHYLRKNDEISLLNPDLMEVDFVELYSISGQKIMSFKDVPQQREISLLLGRKLSSAVYILKVYSGNEVYSKKIIINK